MKTYRLRMALIITLAALWPLQAKEGPINIAVLPFENVSNVQAEDIGNRLAALIEAGLVQQKRFNIIERSQLEKILKEQGLSMSGFAEGSIEPGKIKGVDAVLLGKITTIWVVTEPESIFYTVTIKTKVEANVKLIDTETGEIKLAEVQDGFEKNTLSTGDFQTFPGEEQINQESEALLEKSTKECAEKIIARIAAVYPLEGKVLKVEGKKLWVSLAKGDGVAARQKLDIITLGDVLKDPDTGEIIASTREVIGEAEITRVEEKYSEAVVKRLNKGKTVTAGDLVVTK